MDGSDEADCTIMSLDEGYDKKYPAMKNTTVAISMEILDILDIKELEMEYRVFLKMRLIWNDERIIFRNLKPDERDNQLNVKDIDKLWTPKLLFLNSDQIGVVRATSGDILSADVSKFSGTGTVTLMRNVHPINNPLTEINEDYLYPGNDTAIVMTNFMVVRLGCKFYLKMYPFDSQICSIELDEPNFNAQYILKWAEQPRITGNIDLTQYEVFPNVQYKINSSLNIINVNIRLRRKLSSHIFNTYVPTLCLIAIGGFTLFIDFSHFEATIMVALTTMLVIYTLHQSISATLPATAYMKMIDIWLFGGLVVPFVIIGILIFLDYLVMRENNQVMEMNKKSQWNSKSFMKLMQIILPLTAVILIGSYWIFGLFHYFT